MRSRILAVAIVMVTGFSLPLLAAPALRYQTDVRGGFLLFGNSLGWDCSTTANPNIPPPLVGAVGACNSNITDTAIDVLWRSDSPANGNAQANSSITAITSRTSANLALASNSNVVYARLYWSAENSNAAVGQTIVFEKPSAGFSTTVTADGNYAVTYVNNGNFYLYESTADVTSYIQQYGAGVYRAGDILVKDPTNQVDETAYAAWAVVVVYQNSGEVMRNVTLFDGLDTVSANANNYTTTINGFYVPQQAGYDGKFALVAYEGDATISGDQFYFNNVLQSNAANPNNNFFNATHSYFGNAVSDANDLPQLSGAMGSMTGVDFDVVDVTSLIKPGDTNATLRGTSTQDSYFLGVMAVAISTFKPDFTNTSKTVANLSEANGTRPGDLLEYTLSFSNTGTDSATNVVLTDTLPTSVTYVPGSTRVIAGYNTGSKTDAAGDDQVDYSSSPNKLTIRAGSGANATSGGNLTTSDAATVIKFQATVNAGASGTIANQASVSSKGLKASMQGVGAVSYKSGNGSAPNSATNAAVDACAVNSDCATVSAPHCNTAVSPHACAPCSSTSECVNYEATPVCKTPSGGCVACLTAADCVGKATCVSNACVLTGSVVITAPTASSTVGNTPKISGTAPANSTVAVTLNSNVVGSAVANANGVWTYQSAVLTATTYSATARAVSSNGATAASTAVSFTVRGCNIFQACTAPDTCTNNISGNCVECTAATGCAANANCTNNVCTFAAPTVTNPVNKSSTHVQQPPMAGTAPGGSTVTVTVDGNNLGIAIASAGGTWNFTPTNNLPWGTHSVQVVATAGNANTYATSPMSSANTFYITSGCVNDGECSGSTPACRTSDHTCVRCTAVANCPANASCAVDNTCFVAPPTVAAPANNAVAFSATPAVSGTGPNNATIVVYEDGAYVASTTASSGGAWTVTSNSLSNGYHTIYAVATFGSGASTASSVASSTNSFRVNVGGCSSSANCSGGTPQCNTLNSTCVSCLSSSDCAAPNVCNTSAYTCVRCNVGGDCPTGASCSSNACVIAPPVISAPANASVTNTSPTAVTGTAVANSSVVVSLDGTAGVGVMADATGKWSYPVAASLGYGNHSVSATASLGSGSALVTSATSPLTTFKIGCLSSSDCSSPSVCMTSANVCVRCNVNGDCPAGATCSTNTCVMTAPTVATPANGAVINQATPTFTGGSVANASVAVTVDSSTATVSADGSGNWSYTPTGPLALGSHTVGAVAALGSGATLVTSAASNVHTFSLISGCLSASDCGGNTPVCRTSDHVCVGCLLNGDCSGTPSTPVCDPSAYVCEGCATSGDCSGSTPVCASASHTCVACVVSGDCPSGAVCNANACGVDTPVIATPTASQITNVRRPVLAGTSKANAVMAVSIDGSSVNVNADGSGNWTYTPGSNLTYATHSVSVTATVGTGATAVTSAAATVSFQVVSGCLADSDCPNATQPRCNTSSRACVACLSNSDCSATPSTPTCDSSGTNTCVGCVSDSDCASGATCTTNLCTLAPPNVLAPADSAVTNSTSPSINGNVVLAAAGASVVVTLDGAAGAAVTADSSGNWTYAPVSTLAYGSHTVTAVATVSSGGTPATSAVSSTNTFTVGCLSGADCTANSAAPNCDTSSHTCARCVVDSDCPGVATCTNDVCGISKPLIAAPAQASQTSNTTPTISGSAVANANILLSLDNGADTALQADSSGAWTFTPASSLNLGDHNVLVVASLGSGALIVSATSDLTTFRVTVACSTNTDCISAALPACDTTVGKCVQCLDNSTCATGVCNTTAKSCVQCVSSSDCASPATCDTSANTCGLPAPVVSAPADGSTINTPSPLISGTGTALANVQISVDGTPLGSTTVLSDNTWSFTPSSTLVLGSHSATAVQSTGTGSQAVASAVSNTVSFTLVSGCLANSDCSSPSAPVCNTTSRVCVGCTNSSQCAGRQCDPTAQQCVDCLSDSDCGSAGAPACSSHVCVRCTTDSYCPAPATCTAPSCVLSTPTVSSPANNSNINHADAAVSGAADSGVTVWVTLDGGAAVSVTADATGNWTFQPSSLLALGSHTVTVTSSVGAGAAAVNSSVSATQSFQLVSGCLSNSDCSSPTATLCDTQQRVCVGCLSNSDCSTPTGRCDSAASRICVGCVGNSDCPSGATCSQTSCGLAAPTLSAPVSGSTLNTHAPSISGTAVVGSDVWVFLDGNLIGNSVADANGNWSFVPSNALSDNSHNVYAMATVGSGSQTVTSAASPTSTFTVVTGCLRDGDCGGGQPRCDMVSHACVACLSNTDCSASAPVCDTSDFACVGCLAASDCPAATPSCDTVSQQCVRCLTNSDCTSPATCSVGTCNLAAPVIAAPLDGNTINTPLPNIGGTAAANANVFVTLDGNVLAPVVSDGNWTVTLATALVPGTHTLTALAVLGSPPTAISSPASSPVTFLLVVGCLADGDCPSGAPHCLNPNHVCVGCLDSTQCTSGSTNICNPNNTCVECLQDSNCTADANRTHCYPNLDACVGCLNDASCPATLPRCDTHATWACVRCFVSADCPTGAKCSSQQCTVALPQITVPTPEASVSTEVRISGRSTLQGASIAVLLDGVLLPPVAVDANGTWAVVPSPAPALGPHTLAAQALLGTTPNTAASALTANQNFTVVGACAVDSDCAGSTPLCRADATCVGCIGDANCQTPTGACNPDTDQCVQCVGDSDCSGSLGACDTVHHLCVGCVDSSQCTQPNAALCNVASQSCVQCLSHSDCPVATPACDGTAHQCVGCVTSADCPTAAPVCNTSTQACVGCLSNLDCTGSTPVCELLATVCVGCQGDGDCTSGLPKCDLTAHSCERCLTDGDCPTGALCNQEICSLATPVILSPADGSSASDGNITISGTTAPNAAVNVMLDDVTVGNVTADGSGAWSLQAPVTLGTGQHDVEVYATVGTGVLAVTSEVATSLFSITSNCTQDTDCTSPTPLCDTANGVCVQCNSSTDCPSNAPVCYTVNHTCLLCNDAYGSNAVAACPNASAPVCAHSGVCLSCASNADCLGNAAGSECNTTSGTCGSGCGGDADCATDSFCNSGACSPKLANGAALPAGSLPCSTSSAQRVCLSGVCDAGLNTCGHVNGQACSDANACIGGACGSDGRCGLGNGAACTAAAACRVGLCGSDGLCGLPDNAACRSTPECRDGVCFPDGRCGLGQAVACATGVSCRAGACAADGACGAINGAACTAALDCRSGACRGGVCASSCTGDADCDSSQHCAQTQCVANAAPTTCSVRADCWPGQDCSSQQCVALLEANAPCTADAACAGGVCAPDGHCGWPEGFPCVDPVACRSGTCSADSGVCASACGADADCLNTQFCDVSAHVCQALEANAAPCSRAAQCAAYVCGADGACGQVNDATCANDSMCRVAWCDESAALCGKGAKEACTSWAECRTNSCGNGMCQTCKSDTDCHYGTCDIASGTCKEDIDTANYRMAGTGFGCSATPPAYAAGLILLWLLRQRARRSKAAVLAVSMIAAVLVLGLGSQAHAAAARRFTLDRYNPTAIGESSLWVERPWYTEGADFLTVGLTFDYAHDPLQLAWLQSGKTTKTFAVIEHELVGRLELAAAFWNRLNVGISLPMVLLERGVSLFGITPLQRPTFSDPSLALLGRILGERMEDMFSLHVGVEAWLPLQNTATASDNGVRVLPKIIVGGMLGGGWDYAATVGVLVRNNASIGVLPVGFGNTAGNEIQVGLATSWYTPERVFSVGPEAVYGNQWGSTASSSAANSLEISVAAHVLLVDALRLSASVGAGMLGAPGTPNVRGLLRLAYTLPLESHPTPLDQDGDGVADAVDACPTVAGSVHSAAPKEAGCVADGNQLAVAAAPAASAAPGIAASGADADRDGVLDAQDLCPTQPQGEHADPNRLGCPMAKPKSDSDPDTDGDGITDSADGCKTEAAGPFPDPEKAGCPLRDRDGDMVPDATDACPDKAGAPSPKAKENGCPGLVTLQGDRIIILEQVNFVAGKDVISPKSFDLLLAIKNVLQLRPNIGRVSIEGHTDNKGKPAANMVLSEKRAAAVRKWLVQHGVESGRLEFHGFGDSKPIATNVTPAGRALNRRVEFMIVPAPAQ